jgi:hypothetical protein
LVVVVGDIDWEFDRTPASRSRRGGNPAEYAFEGDLETFVREVIQNANDQGREDVEIEFTFVELDGERREDFYDAINWQSLEQHLTAAKDSGLAKLVKQYLDEVLQDSSLLLLEIEDRNTVGLNEAAEEDTSHFTALCRDTLFSHKQEANRVGGSYGLGKSVLWSFSGLSTVLCNSKLSDEPDDHRRSPRLIGRTELPSHALRSGEGEQWYTGSGWFGQVDETKDGAKRAVSVWDGEAAELAERLYVDRDTDQTGTSILIVGFRDPTNDEDRTPRQLFGDIREAATRYFWPALSRQHETLDVSVGLENDDPEEAGPVTLDAVSPSGPTRSRIRAPGPGRSCGETARTASRGREPTSRNSTGATWGSASTSTRAWSGMRRWTTKGT